VDGAHEYRHYIFFLFFSFFFFFFFFPLDRFGEDSGELPAGPPGEAGAAEAVGEHHPADEEARRGAAAEHAGKCPHRPLETGGRAGGPRGAEVQGPLSRGSNQTQLYFESTIQSA